MDISLDQAIKNALLHNTKSNIKSGKEAGVLVRIDQASLNQIKYALRDFLPHWFNYDMGLPTEYSTEFDWFYKDVGAYQINWHNITYSEANLNL